MKPFRILLALSCLLALAGLVALLGVDEGHHGEADPSGIGIPVAFAAGNIGGDDGDDGDDETSCSCTSWVNQGCGGGGCSQFTMSQTRTCSPSGCSSTSQCASSSTCCSCGPWVKQGCGQGSCGSNQRLSTRTCSNGCGAAKTCTYDTSCVTNPDLAGGNWKPYGFAIPGDPLYSFTYPDNEQQDFLALAAKGNVILGDYTSSQFQTNVLPKLKPGASSLTQPYAVDPTDAALGYHTGSGGFMYDAQGRPLFDGNYDQTDTGVKLDGSPRKFYESTLSDAAFQQLVNPNDPLNKQSGKAKLDGVYFTNHALAGVANATNLNVNGSLVARDDALMFRQNFYLNHDIRLLDSSAVEFALPVTIKRPQLRSWQECPSSGCP